MSRYVPNLSGSCSCKAISFSLENTEVGQILNCLCKTCRKVSGSKSVPFVAVPKEPFWSQIQSQDGLKAYSASEQATRYFCSVCSSFLCMQYTHEKHTSWIPLGTLDNGLDDITNLVDETKDCQIFQQEEAPWGETVASFKKYNDFGLYKSDCCSGNAWD
jgi:hypothetical protein